jgi:site-specific recombinase XerD
MDPLGPHPLIRSFERHLYAENRSSRTVTGYLVAVRQADTFLRERGTSLEAATRGDLEAFLGDLLSRRKASTAATYHKVLKILYGWLRRALDPHAEGPQPVVPTLHRKLLPDQEGGLRITSKGPAGYRAPGGRTGGRGPGRLQGFRCW